jgi:glycosyltransferase involved in cell wall biosynthesis
LRVMVLGLRGIPNVQGGIETHVEHLYPRLVKLGCDVDVICRTPYVDAEKRQFGAIRLRRIWSPQRPGLEAFVHSLLGVIYAGFSRPDILHIHGIGPAAVTPLARLFGLRVVVTHHGPDYDRDKWGPVARAALRFGERMGMRYANARIVISRVIADLVRSRHGRDSVLIPNGVVVPELEAGAEHVLRFGLQPGKYFLQVSRIVPEKRQLELIEAFRLARPAGWKLALVGGLGADSYSKRVRASAETDGVVLTDFLTGAPLRQVYTHAGAFVLPSSHEGLPIAMLEALSYGLPVIASDIPANLEVGLVPDSYFPLGDVAALARLLERAVSNTGTAESRDVRRRWVESRYDWDTIAGQTMRVYRGMFEWRTEQ